MLFLEGVIGIHRTGELQLLLHQWLGHRTWIIMMFNGFALEMDQDQFVVCETAPKY